MTGIAQEEEIDFGTYLSEDVPCSGIFWSRRAIHGVEESCDQPATWRGVVRCCGTRQKFNCDDHKRRRSLNPVCIVCNAPV